MLGYSYERVDPEVFGCLHSILASGADVGVGIGFGGELFSEVIVDQFMIVL